MVSSHSLVACNSRLGIRLAQRLEPFDPLWFEEPIPPGQPEAMGKVAAKTTIPIATGERLTTKYEFYDLLRAGGASILQMNVARVGGLLEAKKIAQANGVSVDDLKAVNAGVNWNGLKVGQKIKLPAKK